MNNWFWTLFTDRQWWLLLLASDLKTPSSQWRIFLLQTTTFVGGDEPHYYPDLMTTLLLIVQATLLSKHSVCVCVWAAPVKRYSPTVYSLFLFCWTLFILRMKTDSHYYYDGITATPTQFPIIERTSNLILYTLVLLLCSSVDQLQWEEETTTPEWLITFPTGTGICVDVEPIAALCNVPSLFPYYYCDWRWKMNIITTTLPTNHGMGNPMLNGRPNNV